MVVSTDGAINLRDIAATMRNNREEAPSSMIIDLALERNDIAQDLLVKQANNGDTDDVFLRTALPKAVFTAIYEGVSSSKSSYAHVRNTAGSLESKMEFAKKALEKAVNKNAFLKREAAGHVDAMVQEMVQMLIYGNLRNDPRGFNGLMKHYSKHSSNDEDDTAFTTVTAGGTADKTLQSILLVGWGDDATHCFYPEGSASAGVRVGERKAGELTNPDAETKTYEGYVQHFYWDLGLNVMDWRKNGRRCNIDATAHQASDTATLKASAEKFFRNIDVLTGRVDETGVRHVLYMSKMIWEQARVFSSILTRANAVTEKNLDGHKVRELNGIQVRINRAMNIDEELVPAVS